MNILEELNRLLTGLGIAVETGVFSGKAPDEYVVITPLSDDLDLYADNLPQSETQGARLSLYSKRNYLRRKRQIVRALLDREFTVTGQLYVGREDDTGYFHATIDTVKQYVLE
jgi:hypothetical protein